MPSTSASSSSHYGHVSGEQYISPKNTYCEADSDVVLEGRALVITVTGNLVL